MALVIFGLGSNVGERLQMLEAAVDGLSEIGRLKALSSVYESKALLPEDAPAEWNVPYYNMAVAVYVQDTPEEVLVHIKSLEASLGRQGRGRWGPREIDIDILAWDQGMMREEALTIPHVGLLERDFALLPLAEVVPEWSYPVPGEHEGLSARELVERLGMKTGKGLKVVMPPPQAGVA